MRHCVNTFHTFLSRLFVLMSVIHSHSHHRSGRAEMEIGLHWVTCRRPAPDSTWKQTHICEQIHLHALSRQQPPKCQLVTIKTTSLCSLSQQLFHYNSTAFHKLRLKIFNRVSHKWKVSQCMTTEKHKQSLDSFIGFTFTAAKLKKSSRKPNPSFGDHFKRWCWPRIKNILGKIHSLMWNFCFKFWNSLSGKCSIFRHALDHCSQFLIDQKVSWTSRHQVKVQVITQTW